MGKKLKRYIGIVLVLFALSASALTLVNSGLFTGSDSDKCVFTAGGDLYLYDADKSSLSKLQTSKGCYLPSLSNENKKISVINGIGEDSDYYSFTIYDLDNRTSKTTRIQSTWVNQSDAILDSYWVGEKMLISSHLNPDNSLYTLIDPENGTTIQEFSGALLKLIPSTDSYIYRSTYAKFRGEQQHLMIDNSAVYQTEPDCDIIDLAVSSDGTKLCFFEVNVTSDTACLVLADILENRIVNLAEYPIPIEDTRQGLLYEEKGICLIEGMNYKLFSQEERKFAYGGPLLNAEDEQKTKDTLFRFNITFEKSSASIGGEMNRIPCSPVNATSSQEI